MTARAPARDPMFIPYDHEAEIEIDRGEVRVEAIGRFADESEWDAAELLIAQLTLVAWEWEEEWYPRDRLTRIVGDHALTVEERRITETWAETAEADRADSLADQARDEASDLGDYLNDLAEDRRMDRDTGDYA